MKKLIILLNCCILLFSSNLHIEDKILNQEVNKHQKEISAITKFSLDILSNNIKQNENTVYSPILVHNILSLLLNGIKEQEQNELELVLGSKVSETNEFYKDYFKNYNSKDFTISNLLWINSNLTLKNSFENICKDFSFVGIKNIDFAKNKLKDIINLWIDSCTNHTINNIVSNIRHNDKLIITSVLYFKSNWNYPFLKENNITDSFFASNGNNANIEYMHNVNNYQYINNKSSKGVIIPYQSSNFSFFILLPNENILLENYIKNLSETELLDILQNGKKNHTIISLFLPKFKVEYSNDITNVLNGNLTHINLSTIFKNEEDFYIKDIYHKTFFSIDENGTEASSAVVLYVDSGIKKENIKPIVLKFNRPFIFGILDNQTNIPVLIGAIKELY